MTLRTSAGEEFTLPIAPGDDALATEPTRNSARFQDYLQNSGASISMPAARTRAVAAPGLAETGMTKFFPRPFDSSYDCVDRIVLNGYHRMGHEPAGFRTWWRR
jgi:hypothetical protein